MSPTTTSGTGKAGLAAKTAAPTGPKTPAAGSGKTASGTPGSSGTSSSSTPAKTTLSTHKSRWEAAFAPNYTTPSLQLESGTGCTVYDNEGKRYTDLLAGIAVSILGHAHPAIVAAVSKQIGTLAHTSNLYASGPGIRLAERLQATTTSFSPGHKVIFQNSGTEANEAALKLVRRHAHAQDTPDAVVVAFTNSFHGRTLGALALTGQTHYQEKFAPLPGQIVHVPFNDPAALEKVFATNRVAGVFFESVQGEGGITPMDAATAKTLGNLARKHNALLVADEIQAGMGRTGKFYGFEHDGLKPDVITLAKGLGGGLPLGAALIHPKHATLFGPGAHGTTFGGNAVSCAAGNAVLDVLEQQKLIPRAGKLGAEFMKEVQRQGKAIGLGARGRGLLVGLPLGSAIAPQVVDAMRTKGYLVGQAGKTVLRIAPPMIVSDDELMGAIPHIVDAVKSAPPPAPTTNH